MNGIIKKGEQQYKCPECDYVCTEDKMLADCTDGEAWSNWICPKCGYWQISLNDWKKLGSIKKSQNE